MIKEGCLDNIEEVYGFHNIPNFDEGDIRVCEGAIMAADTQVYITITGKGGHGSSPHKNNDPIVTASMMLNSFHSIKARDIDSRRNIVFSICHISSGHTYNVVPDTASMEGTVRSYDKESLGKMKTRIQTICDNIAESQECTVELKMEDMYPPVINHPE